MTREELFHLLKDHNQHHIVEHYHRLSQGKRENFYRELSGLDLPLIFELYQEFSQETLAKAPKDIQPARIIPPPK